MSLTSLDRREKATWPLRAQDIASRADKPFAIFSYPALGGASEAIKRTRSERRSLDLFCKRAADLSLSLMAIIALAPLMLTIGLIIKLTIGGKIFFSHQRVGRGGRIFHCYKFRSMVLDSANVLERHLAYSAAARAEWNAFQKLTDDPRVTAFGKFLRKTSLDELPQFFNVLRGDMSLVGPRPVTSGELHRYGEYTSDYESVRPGLTGLWQVSGRSRRSYAERVALDRIYVRRRTFWLDCVLLAKTIPAVLTTHETA